MKKIAAILIILSLLSGCSAEDITSENPELKSKTMSDVTIRGVWIYFDEISMVKEKGGTAESFRKKMNTMLDNCVSFGINTVFFHVRPFTDSFYKSELFPMSSYLTGVQGKTVSYDPLQIAIDCAHERNISLHAWINPFRISFSDDVSLLADSNPAKKLIENKSDSVCFVNGGFYFNPSSTESHTLIINGVKEIVNNYNVDGIHIDDYFYPGTDESIDKAQYEKYVSQGGKMALKEWRMQCVSSFVSNLYSTVKAANVKIIVSISPAGNVKNNYDMLFADVKKWGNENGYCDWLIPQLYFGFEDSSLPYETAMKEWRENTENSSVKLIAGLGAYKAVNRETEEWKSGDIISRQWNAAEKIGYDGFALFSYSSIVASDFGKNVDFLIKSRKDVF